MNIEIFNFVVLIVILSLLRSLFLKKNDLKQLCCGIIGFSGVNPANTDKLNFLMYNNYIERGKDSTGIYTLGTGVKKDTGNAYGFLKRNKLPEGQTMFIGHVRASTIGNNIVKNAHPFEYDNLVGVHNGTLTNHISMLINNDYSWNDFDVDSQALYKLLDDNSKLEIDNKYKTLSKYEGAAALLFTDKREPGKLYAYRNNERPLFCGKIGDDMYLSSLDDSLRIIGCEKVEYFIPYHLYTIENGVITGKEFYPEYKKPVITTYRNGVNNNYLSNVTKFLNNLADYAKVNNSELLGRWVKCLIKNTSYCKKSIDIKEGNYYLVNDYDVNNNMDIFITDEKFNRVKVNKYWFELENLAFEEYVTLMEDIVNKKNGNDKDVFSMGDVTKIVDKSKANIKKKPYITVECENVEKGYCDIYTDYARPSTKAEIARYEAKLVEKAKDAKVIKEFIDTVNQVNQEEQAKLAQNDINDEQTVNALITDAEIIEEIPNNQGLPDMIELTVYNHVLDILSDDIEELKELAGFTNYQEIKDKIEDVESTISQAYDVNLILDSIADREQSSENSSCKC